MKLDKIIVSEKAFKSKQPYDIVYSNITVVNLLRDEGIEDEYINEDALASYFADYYQDQYKNGGFSQFVWNSRWQPAINESIKKGLEQMSAEQHLALFLLQCQKVEALTKAELEKFLQNDYFDENETINKLDNDLFYSIDEQIIGLNADWLKTHPKLQVLSIEDMFLEVEKFIGRKIER